jgi:hypothetical protein
MRYTLFFATALMLAEIMLGTAPLFAACVFIYVMLTALAFNVAGGMYTYSGSYIGLQSLQTFLIAQVAKVALLQRADSNLHVPLTTVAVYTVGEFSLLMAAVVTRRVRKKNPILDSRFDSKFTMAMSMTASLIGIVAGIAVGTVGSDQYGNVEHGSLWSYIMQLGDFLVIGIMLGTAHIIAASGGKRSARWWTIIPIVSYLLFGIANNTKQGIYEGPAIWVVCCALYRYKFNRLQVVGMIAGGIFSIFVVFPVVQYSRGYVREGNLVNRAELVYGFMRDHSVSSILTAYHSEEDLKEEDGHLGYFLYYGKDEGLLDRVSLVSVDDAAINYTLSTGPHGYDSFMQEFIFAVPRFLLPDKDRYLHTPVVNDIGRETGILAPTDESTYIAFSTFGPSFYMGGWFAVSIVTFVVMAILFTAVDSFYGDARVSLYALFTIAGNLHGAPEFILPAAFGSLLHLCFIDVFTLAALRRLSSVAQIFIQRYSWYEKSPDSLAVPRPAPRQFVFPGARPPIPAVAPAPGR